MNKDTCYFCTTPYQILSIIPIAIERKEIADLYIIPQFDDADKYAANIRKESIFSEVFVVDEEKIYKEYIKTKKRILNHFCILGSYFFVNQIVQDIIVNDAEYKNMFISSRAYISRLVYLYFIKNKKNVHFFYFDDGEGSYDNISLLTPRKTDKIVRLLLFGKKAIETNYDRYLYSPKLFREMNSVSGFEIYNIPNLFGDNIEVYNRIFNISENDIFSEKVIIIDMLQEECFDEANKKKLNQIYSDIIELFGMENVIIKKHPRDRSIKNEKYKYYKESSVPFELICANSKIEDKVLVSFASSALVSPKILMGKEPKVILLYKLIDGYGKGTVRREEFYSYCKKMYNDVSRFCIPEDISEYKQQIANIYMKDK